MRTGLNKAMTHVFAAGAIAAMASMLAVLPLPSAHADDWPKRHRVLALNKAYDSTTNSTYFVYDAALADQLNTRLAQVTWADESCDFDAYTNAFRAASAVILGAIGQRRAEAETQLKGLYEALPHPNLDNALIRERWRRHCTAFFDGQGALTFKPAHVAEFTLPCLVPMRSDRKDVLWCKRAAAFYSEELKRTAERAMAKMKSGFLACGSKQAYEAETSAGGRIYEAAEAANDRGRDGLRDELADYYDLRRKKKYALADEMIRADRGLASSLTASYSTPRFTEWCTKRQNSSGQ
jgi:hypothetical protein